MKNDFQHIENAILEFQKGKMLIVVDDEDRENEGDLVMAAEKVTPQTINFMAKHARGLICVPMVESRLKRLGINSMVKENSDIYRTDFTISVDSKSVKTGISAKDVNIVSDQLVAKRKNEKYKRIKASTLAKLMSETHYEESIYNLNDQSSGMGDAMSYQGGMGQVPN